MNKPMRGSKASATTTCQKCLKRGHYSYECQSKEQDRPYVSRPSRTQQFWNPKLKPKLTNSALPEDPTDRPAIDGNERKRAMEDLPTDDYSSKRSRSRSHSRSSTARSSSVATISTRASSGSPNRRGRHSHRPAMALPTPGRDKKRRRASSVISGSDGGRDGSYRDGRNTRHRKGSSSPRERGRAVSRDGPGHGQGDRAATQDMRAARGEQSPYSRRAKMSDSMTEM